MSTKTVRATLTLPDIDIETLFLDYFSKSESFQSKFYKPVKDPNKKALNLFKIKKGTHFNKVLLFLSELYIDLIHLAVGNEGKMHIGNHNKINKLNPHMERHSQVQEKWMQPQYRKLLIKFMKDTGLIQIDESYWTEFANKPGSKSKGYRIHNVLYSNSIKWNTKYVYLDEGLLSRYRDKSNNMRWLNSYHKVYKKIYKGINNWALDIDTIPANLRKECEKSISKFKKAEWFTVSHGGRVYTPIGMIDKRLRKYIYYKPNKDLKFALIDVSNCTYWGLSVFMTKQRDWFKNDLETVYKFIIILEEYIKNLTLHDKDKITDLFAKYVATNNYEELLKGIINLDDCFINNQEAFKAMELLYEGDDIPNDALTFMILSCLGVLYEVMGKHMGVPRSKFKNKLNKILNLRRGTLYRTGDKYKEVFKNKFNNVYELILEVGNIDSNNFSFRMNNFESELLLHNFAYQLFEEEIPILTIHDGLLIPASDASEIAIYQKRIKQLSKDLFGLPIPLKQEKL